ncbi:MAG: porin family protein [Prolixibacteraceae bacterium]
MKNKLSLIVSILVLAASFAVAQDRPSFGILGGMNFQNLNGKAANGDKLENDMQLGFHGGVNVQIPVAPEFYFQPGLMYTTKGAKNSEGSLTSKIKLNYIEMPLNFVYKAPLGNGFFMLGFGPYLAYAVSGNVETKGGSVTLDQDIEFTNEVKSGDPLLTPYYKAFDAGAGIFAGYESAGGLFLQLNTQLGLLNINPEYEGMTDDDSAVKNTGFGLSLGYRF